MKRMIRSNDEYSNEFEVKLVVTARVHFDDPESDAGTARYQLEQDLEDLGWDVDVELLDED